MDEPYTPPEMPAYPEDYESVLAVLAPYYHDVRPLDFFFEMYILAVLEKLPNETRDALTEFSKRNPTWFERHHGDWSKYVFSELHLSDTIEIAIWDLWIRHSASARLDRWTYHPWHFAQNFVHHYSKDDSQVDVWTPETLRAARERINEFRGNQSREDI